MSQPSIETAAPVETADDGIPIDDEPIRLYSGAEVSAIVQKRLAAEKKKHAAQIRAAVLTTAEIVRGKHV